MMEGNSATLCVDFNYKFATNFSINVVLTNQTFDDPGKSVALGDVGKATHGKLFFEVDIKFSLHLRTLFSRILLSIVEHSEIGRFCIEKLVC